MSDARVMQLWRDCGLPEYFLGNGGTNTRLAALAERIRAEALEEAAQVCIGLVRQFPQCGVAASAIRALKDEV